MKVWVSGPATHADHWLEAARSAQWEAEFLPLIEIEDTDVDLVERIDGLPDWLCVTSSNALPALERAAAQLPELLTVPFATVGESTAERARSSGFKARLVERSGAELARAVLAEGAERVLWPHGSLSDEFAEQLRAAGVAVDAPVVYRVETVPHATAPGAADAVQLTSPSAVRAWSALVEGSPRQVPVAIAVGPTTAAAIEEHDALFADVQTLDSPTPEAFEACLRELATR